MFNKKRFIRSFLVVFFCLSACAFGYVNGQDVHASGGKVRKNDIKITLLSIGSGSTRITYERAIVKNMSAEFTLGMIGWGYDLLHNTNAHGFLMKFAYKWNLIPLKKANSPLAGFYVKPELQFVNFDYHLRNSQSPTPIRVTQCAILGECGYQYMAKWFLFDVYAGFGPGFGTGNEMNYYHGFMFFPIDSWLAVTAGFRIGVAF